MSYILDALRKADAQRERDASRGIHAQAATLGSSAVAAEPGGRTGCFALMATGVVVAATAAWFVMRPGPAPVVVAAPATPPATVAATAISPPPPAPVAQPVSPVPMAPAAVQAREAAFTARGSGGVAPRPDANTQAAASPSAPIAGGLPSDAPRVAISGGVYSPNPAQRMLIVGGQVFNEGSEIAPGVKLEAIQARTAVLGFRGARYTVAY